MLIIDNKKLSPGDIISRKKLVDTYNTSNQGGITPSKENKLIFIFSDPNIGEKFGYNDGLRLSIKDYGDSWDYFKESGEKFKNVLNEEI